MSLNLPGEQPHAHLQTQGSAGKKGKKKKKRKHVVIVNVYQGEADAQEAVLVRQAERIARLVAEQLQPTLPVVRSTEGEADATRHWRARLYEEFEKHDEELADGPPKMATLANWWSLTEPTLRDRLRLLAVDDAERAQPSSALKREHRNWTDGHDWGKKRKY